MNKAIYFSMFLMALFTIENLKAQVNGVSIDYSGSPTREPKAIFQLNSTEQGAILPRMTAAQRIAIAPPASAKGMTVYQTDGTQGYFYWDGTQWLRLMSTAGTGSITVTPSGVGLSVTGSPVSLGGTVTITSNATSSNTPNTIVSRNASGDFSAGLITANFNGEWRAKDDRIIEPNSITSRYAQFGFTSYNNNNSAPYADYLHLRSYGDGSGGNDNLVMFAKNQIAMRVYQHAWNSATPYSTYKTVAFVEDLSNFSGLASPSATIGLTAINGSATTALRSDAAPALSQAIIPTWTGTHTFNNGTYSALFTGGNVGIGTTAPSQKLTISGGHGDTKMRLHSIGNGTDQPSNLSLWASEPGVTYTGTGIGYNVNGHPNFGRIDATRGSAYTRYLDGQIKMEFQTSGGTTVNNVVVVNDNGRVGIGTAGPTQTLDVDGTIRIRGGNPALNRVLRSDASGNATWVDATTLTVTGDNLGNHTATQNIELNNNWLSNDGGSEGIKVDNSGNVGIGTTPTERLDVNGDVKISGLAGTGNRLVHASSNGVLQTNGTITKVDPIVIRGTGLNHNSNRLLKIGDTQVYNTSGGRGLTFTIIQKSNHALVSTTNYDTYGNAADANNLATALNGLNNNQVGVLTSYDAWEGQVTTNLKDAFKRLGLYKALMTTVGGSRRTYAAIFEGASNSSVSSASAVEVAHSADAAQPFSEVRGWLIDGGFVANSQVPSGLSTPIGEFAVGVNESGDVGIGTASPTYKLHVMGRLKTTGINETSDIRLKSNIEPISNALSNVLKMEGVTYNWKNKEYPDMGLNDGLQHGLIAQDLEKIVPELVLTDKEGWKSIEYTHLVPMLIEAIKDLSAELNEQKSAYNTLKAQVDRIDNSLLQDRGSAQQK